VPRKKTALERIGEIGCWKSKRKKVKEQIQMKGLLKRHKERSPKRQKRDEVSKSAQDWNKKRRKRVQKPKRNKSKTPKQNKYAYKNPKIKKIQ